MSMALMHSTQIGVSLSLTIVTKTNDNTRLDMAHLADLTLFIFWLWSFGQGVDRLTSEAARLAAHVVFTVEELYYQALDWLAEPVNLPCQKPLSKILAKNLYTSCEVITQVWDDLKGFWQTFLTKGVQ